VSDTVPIRALLAQTAEVLGSQHEARWLCEVAVGADGGEFDAALDEPATGRAVAHLDARTRQLGLVAAVGVEHLELRIRAGLARHIAGAIHPQVGPRYDDFIAAQARDPAYDMGLGILWIRATNEISKVGFAHGRHKDKIATREGGRC